MDEHVRQQYPRYRNHFLPRTRAGAVATVLFMLVFACAQPPIVFLVANRIEPLVFGLPFLYMYLLALYVALIAILIWAQRRGV